jgi:hypothetical protein
MMNNPVAGVGQRMSARYRLSEELCRRQLPGARGWSESGRQLATEPTAWALLASRSSTCPAPGVRDGLDALLSMRQPDGLWSAFADSTGRSLWATALSLNALMSLPSQALTVAASLDALVRCNPLEASWFVRLKFRYSDRQVRFDPTKYGWGWVPGTVSWVVPTSMVVIALARARHRGLIGGKVLHTRLRLGAEMLLDRACPGGGWNAGNPVVYGVPLRPHVDATAIALAALRMRYQHPTVSASLDWLLTQTPWCSPYSLAWLAIALDLYRDVHADVDAILYAIQEHLAARIDDPRSIPDTSTIALAALALGLETGDNPFEVRA